MNAKARLISYCTALLLTFAVPSQSIAAGAPFSDLSGVTAKTKILALQNKGLVNGVGKGLFAPRKTVSAAEGIQLIVNALKLNIDNIRFIKEPRATDYFKRADDDAWYANALIIASINGFDLSPDMDPNRAWTREDFTYHLIIAMEKYGDLPRIKLVPVEISDEDQIMVDRSGAIQRALAYKVASLDSQGKFSPKKKITRAEAAEQIYNALEYLKVHPAP